MHPRPASALTLAALCLTFPAAFAQPQQAAPAITLTVDVTDAPRKLIHARETITVAPGPLTLEYPKWIPGEHAPTGPIDEMAGFTIAARTASGKPCTSDPSGHIEWLRDPVDMFAFHLTVPEGCARLDLTLDFLATASPSGFSAGASTSANVAVVSWNSLVVSPRGLNPSQILVTPSITLPSSWQLGTALHRSDQNARPGGATYTVPFESVPLDTLIDSPVLTGRYVKEIPLAPEITPHHYLDIAAEGPEQLALSSERVQAFSRLVREAGLLFGGTHHYGSYHFLVTLSDSVAHFGLEHHESSDDRMPAKTFIEDDRFTLAGDLLPHEFTHSWNGKYRRPAGLATGNYQDPMVGDLLWVYEGLTQYFGDVLAVRAGVWSREDYLGRLAREAATLDHWPGRQWRTLGDTARSAQLLYDPDPGYESWRRDTDFYEEGELVWLEADTTIRQLTTGRRSLNDFAARFYANAPTGAAAGTSPVPANTPAVVPYTFDQLVTALNEIAPYDWAAFFRTRLDSHGPGAPLGGLALAGYRLTYGSSQTAWGLMQDNQDYTVDFWFSLGLHLLQGDTVADVLKGSPADIAGLGPGMKLIAVNGRAFTPWLLRTAVSDAAWPGDDHSAPPIQLIVQNGEQFRVLTLPYHGGERYPGLDRIPNTPDRLAEILHPLER
jgi:predicted metalloprotease with PDZ domain